MAKHIIQPLCLKNIIMSNDLWVECLITKAMSYENMSMHKEHLYMLGNNQLKQ